MIGWIGLSTLTKKISPFLLHCSSFILCSRVFERSRNYYFEFKKKRKKDATAGENEEKFQKCQVQIEPFKFSCGEMKTKLLIVIFSIGFQLEHRRPDLNSFSFFIIIYLRSGGRFNFMVDLIWLKIFIVFPWIYGSHCTDIPICLSK